MKYSPDENLEYLVKLQKLDLIGKFVLYTALSIGSYYAYTVLSEKIPELKEYVDEYKKKVASIPFFGSMLFKE